jgi:hypothetical protein
MLEVEEAKREPLRLQGSRRADATPGRIGPSVAGFTPVPATDARSASSAVITRDYPGCIPQPDISIRSRSRRRQGAEPTSRYSRGRHAASCISSSDNAASYELNSRVRAHVVSKSVLWLRRA